MAFPTLVGWGGIQGVVSGDCVPALPSGWAADDIFLLLVETANQAVSDPAGWTEIVSQGAGTAGSTVAVRLQVYWRRAVGGDSAPSMTAGAHNHIIACVGAIRGCPTTGNPWDFITAGNIAAGTTLTATGGTTLGPDRLAVILAAQGEDGAVTRWSAWANSDLANVTEVRDNALGTGNGGGFGGATGEKATAGAFGNTTATLDVSFRIDWCTIAFKPAVTAVDGTGSISGGGTLTVTGQKQTSSAPSVSGGGSIASSGTKVAASTASISGGGAVAVTGIKQASSAVSISGGGSLTASGEASGGPVDGTASLSGAGECTATGQKVASAPVSVSGGGTVAVAGHKLALATVTISTNGEPQVSGTKEAFGSSTLSGGGQCSASGGRVYEASAVISGGGNPTASGTKQADGSSIVSGGGALSESGLKAAAGIASISGGGTLSAVASGNRASSIAISGGGLLLATGTTHRFASIVISGGGTLTVTGGAVQPLTSLRRRVTSREPDFSILSARPSNSATSRRPATTVSSKEQAT